MDAGPSLCLRSAHSCWSSEAADHQPVLTSAPSWTRWWQRFCLGWILRGGSGGEGQAQLGCRGWEGKDPPTHLSRDGPHVILNVSPKYS